MTDIHPDPSRQLVLQRGADCALWNAAGTVLVCLEGRVRCSVPVPGLDQPWPHIVSVAMGQGESYRYEQAARLHIVAESRVRLLCIPPARPGRVWARRLLQAAAKYAMISYIRRGVEQSGSSSGS